ncbi:family 1 encapsulin nanocompartment shell protein [Tindallia californiensis]|uniref:Type 1 encapsulin shell protein n=1 Tax=Tindallia californiensis TaxID=159292 RepID=A0A1H3MPY8_9FIRM|nr:family 1 encapsulin nanocompartment shell protein [Tindallia californiensis]SDY78666.1 Uncharacterized protein, linocin/CFP29 family [Tindallia californiensis]
MDILKRDLAPLTQEAWDEIDETAVDVLKTHLSARRVVKVQGPKGWDYTVIPEGRLSILEKEDNRVHSGQYEVKPLVETRISFKLDRWEMDNITRGARDIKLDALEEAMEKIAIFEEDAIYNGYEKGGIKGLVESSGQDTISFGNKGEEILEAISVAVLKMKEAYEDGPFTLVVGEEGWKRVNKGMEGYPLIKRIEKLIGGSVIYSSVLDGALLLPQDHDDLEMLVGGDFSIGYESHDAHSVTLFAAESFTFRVLDPDIIISFSM